MDPAIMVGKPCVVGTRITVQLLLNKIAAGWSVGEVVMNYSQISTDDVTAAVSYAAGAMGSPRALQAAEERNNLLKCLLTVAQDTWAIQI